MTSQQRATEQLTLWQQLRNMGLTPEERIERMVRDALAPFVSKDEYEEKLALVGREMEMS